MKTRHILTALAAAGLMAGGQAIAQGRGGGHGAGGVGVGLGGSAQSGIGLGRTRIDTSAGTRVDTRVGRDFGVRSRTDARLNSQGPNHANARARARASDRSVLARGRTTTDLSLLRTGLIVRNSAGADLGTIARINRTGDGRIVNVLVRDPNGRSRTIPVAPNSLSISGDVVTTTLVGIR